MQQNKIKYSILLVVFAVLGTGAISRAQDTLRIKTDSVPATRHSPAKAAFLSAVLPGLGQIYNGKGLYFRLPVLYAGIATESYFIYYLNKQFNSYHNVYLNLSNYTKSLNGATPDPKVEDYILAEIGYSGHRGITVLNLKDANDFYRHYRDLNILFMAGIYLLNIIDATVQAYFFEYDISDDLSLKVQPTILNTLTSKGMVGLKMTFNLH